MRIAARTSARGRNSLRRAIRDRRGSAGVEFAIVAPVFLALMFSMFEAGWYYFANSQVDAAVLEGARFIRTGQAQQQNFDKDQFFQKICQKVQTFGACTERLTVEVETFGSFAALAADNSPIICRTDSSLEINAIPYQPGKEGDIVRIRLCLLYSTINPLIGMNLSQTADGKRKLFASYIVKNEPYSGS